MKIPILVLVWIAGVAACAKGKPEPEAHAGHEAAPDPSKPITTGPSGQAGQTGQGVPSGYAIVDVDPARQQLLGIKTAAVEHRPIDRNIRTIGTVQTDETRTSHVHVKFDGFIEQIYVNYVGHAVRKGQPLFKIFSRDLLAAQQEYLSSREALARIPATAGAAVRTSAQQLVTASRERLQLFDVPPSVLQNIERTGIAARAIPIHSPQTGTVVEKQAIEGLAVTPMMHLYVIADLSKVWVLADVYERDMSQVRVGQPVKMKVDALPGSLFAGVATFVSPVVDPSTRTVKVRFEFENSPEGPKDKDVVVRSSDASVRRGPLKPGMYATVEIGTGPSKSDGGDGGGDDALVIPSDSVVDTGERKIVFVARGNGRFEPRNVVLGAAFNGQYEVTSGLRHGEIIATSGQFLLDSESRIRGARTPGGPSHGAH